MSDKEIPSNSPIRTVGARIRIIMSTQAVVGHAVPLWENIDIIVLCSVAAPRGAAALNELVLFD
ncbi:hypothetical protein MJ575_23330 [Klebsiella pneumoniae]|nr:hypothetical protein MJ575_23330 [Klebsiella pneumoniae]